jgi:hypothetical protein
MRDASECRAKDPRTCYYHGAVITMNEAVARMEKNGNPDPADLDLYFSSRKQVELAEEEYKKRQWLEELREGPTAEVITEPSSKAQVAKTEPAKKASDKKYPARKNYSKPAGAAPKTRRVTQRNQPAAKKPLVPATVNYDQNAFPIQANTLEDNEGNVVILTRHDKAVGTPKGIMLATSRLLTDDEKKHLVGLMQYQHTVSTREDNKAKTVAEDDINYHSNTGRTVYMKTQFKADGSQVKNFHDGLNQLLKEGSAARKDGSQKYPPFAKGTQVVVYYNS